MTFKKLATLAAISTLSLTALTSCGSKNEGTPATQAPATEAPATEAPATETPATEAPTTEVTLKDGTYETVDAEPSNGYTHEMKMVVEGGKITSLVWDAKDDKGNYKAELSENGGYTMTEDGLTWAAQAKLLAEHVMKNNSVADLAAALNDEGKIDTIAGVSINIQGFVASAEKLLKEASATATEVTLKDGTYEKVASEPEQGYTHEMKMVVEGGKITSLVWDAKDEKGNYKAELSENGGYTMTEDGLTWAAQAKLLAEHVMQNNSVADLAAALNDEGKIDTITGVSINIQGFVSFAEELLKEASAN